MNKLSLAAIASLLSVAISPIFAFMTMPYGNQDLAMHMTKSDVALSNQAMHKSTHAKVGATHHWKNTQSGRTGKITLLSRYHHHGMPCHKVHYSVYHKSGDHASYIFHRCRDHNGKWRYR